MKQVNLTYAEAEGCYYEAMRIVKGKDSPWSTFKEGNALINTSMTPFNYNLIAIHPAIVPSQDRKHTRGQGIADYHYKQTGRKARMNGVYEQRSKAVGLIATLPKDYLQKNCDITELEYAAMAYYTERNNGEMAYTELTADEKNTEETCHYRELYKSAVNKLMNHSWTKEENEKIHEFFYALMKSWQKNAGINDEDMLFCVVHMDESTPHMHLMALPGRVGTDGKKHYTTDIFNNYKYHYFDRLHDNIIRLMKEDYGIDAHSLLNGATRGKGFTPGELSKEQRETSVRSARIHTALEHNNEELNLCNKKLEEQKAELTSEIDRLQIKLLTAEQNKALAENKELKKLSKGKRVTLTLTFEEAEGIRKGIYAAETLEYKAIELKLQETRQKQKETELKAIETAQNERNLQLSEREKKLEYERKMFAKEKKRFGEFVKETAKNMVEEALKPFLKKLCEVYDVFRVLKKFRIGNRAADKVVEDELNKEFVIAKQTAEMELQQISEQIEMSDDYGDLVDQLIYNKDLYQRLGLSDMLDAIEKKIHMKAEVDIDRT